ncbi:hypothetical protein ACQ23P_00500 [Staphylococcus cohnii]|uniref:Uncharacterized protein n=1 Tax=Staphylococcus cohnii TaxID=29382 RepID=A0A2T4LR03_9STAP|nr:MULTISPECIES: hypothetical protein [Staphylococcus]MBA1353275.1 hypothetical protein [Staphylococcus cohnii]MBA1391910.1 hypothetical protein [Staphylococcus cohnii]MBB2508565.1 hypothetical protein [Staphylococcus cohnii subsp. barensis]MCE5033810.1 hypothetical protein [Staphylococcus cohnii]MCE5098373.1 hypothetical protein [Staphylococcus cohnii]
MSNQSEQHLRNQFRFQRNFINFPFLGFAIVIALLNIIYPDINLMMTLFGLFFFYNGAILFVAFIKHYKRVMVLAIILTLLSLALFGMTMYLYAKSNNLL